MRNEPSNSALSILDRLLRGPQGSGSLPEWIRDSARQALAQVTTDETTDNQTTTTETKPRMWDRRAIGATIYKPPHRKLCRAERERAAQRDRVDASYSTDEPIPVEELLGPNQYLDPDGVIRTR